MSCLHTLGILGGVREGQQLLLQLGGHVDTRKVGCLRPDPHLVPRLIPQEDALLLLVTLHSRDATRVASRSIDRKSAIDIPSRLVKLDSLPRVLGRLADGLPALNHNGPVGILHLLLLLRLLLVRLHILLLDVALNLILAEAEG